MESVCVKYWVSNIRREWEYYLVLFQSISKMFCSLSIDLIPTEVQCGECLYEALSEQYTERMRTLLYSVSKHQQDVVLLEHRSDSYGGPVCWVSMWSTKWIIERENMNVTLFCCKALARYCAPWTPIWLFWRFSVVILCANYYVSNGRREWEYYLILLQSISKMPCVFVTYSFAIEA